MKDKIDLNNTEMLRAYLASWSGLIMLYCMDDEDLKSTGFNNYETVINDLKDYMDDEKPVSIVKLLEDWEDGTLYKALMITLIVDDNAKAFLPFMIALHKVVMGAYTLSVERCKELGVNFDVCKPLSVDELIAFNEKY